MTRSVLKGPFVDITLIKKAEKLSQSGRKEVLKLGQEDRLFFHSSLD